jgi:uncharacterized protein (TIGR03546 family)
MTLILKQIFSFLKLLNSETGTTSLAAGIACGFILGMGPFLSLQGLLILLIALIFRIQIGAVFLSAFFFSFIAWVFDPFFHMLGMSLLEMSTLKPLWTTLYNLPLIPFTRFNNSIIMGAGVLALILSPFIFVLSKALIKRYRVAVVERFKQTKLWKVIKSTTLFKWYYQYDKLYNS